MKAFIGFDEALELTLSAVPPCGTETIPLEAATCKWLAEDIFSKVDSPSVTTSRKDGYAVRSQDLAAASRETPIELSISGVSYAGHSPDNLKVEPGQAVQITTGAPIPDNADAVISEEFCRRDRDRILCFRTAGPGRNILKRGTDIDRNGPVMKSGQKVSPPAIGLLAAAGYTQIRVHRAPRLVIVASGDEVVLPGSPLKKGQLYASNMMEIRAWLDSFGINSSIDIAADRKADIEEVIVRNLDRADAFLTSGGAWGSEKDLMLKVLQKMDWQGIYHRVRMSPGKPVGFGLLSGRPFFILPGGPPANEMAFLQLALPAMVKMMGGSPKIFPEFAARLTSGIEGQADWTNFIHADFKQDGGQWEASPVRLKSRLKSMARKNGVIIVPEGIRQIKAGAAVQTQLFSI